MFQIPCRVYFEDTDAGGVVYYANYLKYIERCRTEWLRTNGHHQSSLIQKEKVAFVVRRVEADYLRPAILDDLLEVTLRVEKLGGAQIVFAQNISRRSEDGELTLLMTARVQIVSVNAETLRPAPIPGNMKTQLQKAMDKA